MYNIHLEEIDSTNSYAKLNLDKFGDRTIVHASRQTSGHGRLQRAWVDLGEGNLFLTFVLKPSASFAKVYSNLTQYLSVKLSMILEEYGLDPQIKWPNDVLINGKKIAGILSETVLQGNEFKGLVLGIGVNLNSSAGALECIDRPVTALNLELNSTIKLDEFRNKLVNNFFKDYDEFLETGFEFIKEYYIKHASFLDREVCVQIFNEKKSGIAKSITNDGALVLKNDDKEIELTIGDIL